MLHHMAILVVELNWGIVSSLIVIMRCSAMPCHAQDYAYLHSFLFVCDVYALCGIRCHVGCHNLRKIDGYVLFVNIGDILQHSILQHQ